MKRRQKCCGGYRNTQIPASSSSEHKPRRGSLLLPRKNITNISMIDACSIRVSLGPTAYFEVETILFRRNSKLLVVLSVIILHEETKAKDFDVLLTVHTCITLVNNQLDAQFFYFIIRLLQFSTCFDQSCAHHQEVKLH
jgi:hypothetical protein